MYTAPKLEIDQSVLVSIKHDNCMAMTYPNANEAGTPRDAILRKDRSAKHKNRNQSCIEAVGTNLVQRVQSGRMLWKVSKRLAYHLDVNGA